MEAKNDLGSMQLHRTYLPRRGVTCSAGRSAGIRWAPIVVVGTTSLATYIVLEATLSFAGVGLTITTVSWGGDISMRSPFCVPIRWCCSYPSA